MCTYCEIIKQICATKGNYLLDWRGLPAIHLKDKRFLLYSLLPYQINKRHNKTKIYFVQYEQRKKKYWPFKYEFCTNTTCLFWISGKWAKIYHTQDESGNQPSPFTRKTLIFPFSSLFSFGDLYLCAQR